MMWGYNDFFRDHEKTYCGKVYRKISENYFHKSTARTEYYMVVNFDEIGKKEISVSRSTYFDREVGERICFDLDTREHTFLRGLNLIWSFISWFLTMFGIVIGIGWCIYWLFTGKW